MRSAAAVVGAACAVVAVASVAAAPACVTHKCDGQPMITFFAIAVDTAGLRDANTWESSPIDGDWSWPVPGSLDGGDKQGYGPKQDVYLNFGSTNHPQVEEVLVYISADKNPVANGANFGLASGNVAEMTYDANGQGMHIFNDTCAPYYARIVVRFAPSPDGGAPQADAADAARPDGADAGTD